MGWAHVRDTPTGGAMSPEDGSNDCPITAFAVNPVIGNHVVVYMAGFTVVTQPSSGLTCTDNAAVPNSYGTTIAYVIQTGSGFFVWAAVFLVKINSLPSVGNLTITVHNDRDAANTSISACASEWSGGSLNLDGNTSNPTMAGGQSTSPIPGALTTDTPGCLIVSLESNGTDQSSITSPTLFTNVGKVVASPGEPGDADYYVPGGAVSNLNNGWTLSTTSYWAALQVAIKPAAGSSSSSSSSASSASVVPGSARIFQSAIISGLVGRKAA